MKLGPSSLLLNFTCYKTKTEVSTSGLKLNSFLWHLNLGNCDLPSILIQVVAWHSRCYTKISVFSVPFLWEHLKHTMSLCNLTYFFCKSFLLPRRKLQWTLFFPFGIEIARKDLWNVESPPPGTLTWTIPLKICINIARHCYWVCFNSYSTAGPQMSQLIRRKDFFNNSGKLLKSWKKANSLTASPRRKKQKRLLIWKTGKVRVKPAQIHTLPFTPFIVKRALCRCKVKCLQVPHCMSPIDSWLMATTWANLGKVFQKWLPLPAS